MRKLLLALFTVFTLISPAALATDFQYEEEGDMCRQECADDGADPEECQMDCNTIA